MNPEKKSIYPNQGQIIPDFYCTGISRAYIEDGNLFVVLETTTGIETGLEKCANEVVRLIIPIEQVEKLKQTANEAANYALNASLKHKQSISQSKASSKDNTNKKQKQVLGKSLGLFEE